MAPKGNFVNTKGEILGTHEGITHYTVGQRRGLGLPMGHRVFVLEIRPETNEVVVGENEEVFAKVVKANKVNNSAAGTWRRALLHRKNPVRAQRLPVRDQTDRGR